MEDRDRSRWVSTGAGPMLCLGMQSMCRTVSRSVTPPRHLPELTVCWRSIGLCHGAGGRGRRRDRDRWLVASQTVQTAHWADTTSSTYPTHCAILCQILHRNNLDQTKETKKMEKKNLYLSHVSSQEHSSCGPLVVSNIE